MITAATVANANQEELLCITYELLLGALERAIEGANREVQVDKSLKILRYLGETLEMEHDIAKDLFRLYTYVQGLIINSKYKEENLQEAYNLIEKVYLGYSQITKEQSNESKTMQNAQNVYAGVTYGKNDLNEMVLDSVNRGFKA